MNLYKYTLFKNYNVFWVNGVFLWGLWEWEEDGNSSKALIIAGAIFNFNFIIGLGVTIFQNAQKVVDRRNCNGWQWKIPRIYRDNATASDVKQLFTC